MRSDAPWPSSSHDRYSINNSVSLLTVANQPKLGLCEFVRSGLLHGFDIHILGAGMHFRSVLHAMDLKPDLLLNFSQANYAPSCTRKRRAQKIGRHYYVFADAFDVVVQNHAQEVLRQLVQRGAHKVHFSGETYLFPNSPPYRDKYPHHLKRNEKLFCAHKVAQQLPSLGLKPRVCWNATRRDADLTQRLSFPFLNSGMYAGEKSAVVRLLRAYRRILHSGSRHKGAISDQAIFHQLHHEGAAAGANGSIAVDRNASLFLNMCCPSLELLDDFVRHDETREEKIYIPAVYRGSERWTTRHAPSLLHWPGSTIHKSRAYTRLLSAQKASRRGCAGTVSVHPGIGAPPIDAAAFLKPCLRTIEASCTTPMYEMICSEIVYSEIRDSVYL